MLVFFLFIFGVAATQNKEAEEHCQKFLTSPNTAPIVNGPRDLAVDTEAERWCKLVLSDPDLPLNIRGVVLEGLAHMYMKHEQQQLNDRSVDAYATNEQLVLLFPDSPRFLLTAALYARRIGKIKEAYNAITSRVDDLVSTSEEDSEHIELIQRLRGDLGASLNEQHAGASSEL